MAKLHFRPYIPNQTVLFPGRIDENIAANDPVRVVNTVVDNLNLDNFKKLYKATGRCPYHPKMMLKVIIYAYMNNIYSCRKIEKLSPGVTFIISGFPVMNNPDFYYHQPFP
ncbi:MAG: transposase [Parabacteroides sp.]